MKIIGLDKNRTELCGGIITYFELERMPDTDWINRFLNLFITKESSVWIEGYCIVINSKIQNPDEFILHLQEMCDKATGLNNAFTSVNHSFPV